jgi:hypothetical protein
MVDNTNPTTQFHPYQAPDATPQTGATPTSGLGSMLEKVGLNKDALNGITDSMKNMNLGSITDTAKNVDVRGSVSKARDYARANPGAVLGGLAALVIGAGLLRKRSA